MTNTLPFEIWEDTEHRAFQLARVSAEGDETLKRLSPNSVLRHQFRASSEFEAYQMNYDWHGWGLWKPEPDWEDHAFTSEEVILQEQYLAIRK